MHSDFWHQRWQENAIAFHESNGNTLLAKHFDRLSLEDGSRIFLPLCGKTRDIPRLMEQGCRITGAELSPIAVEQLFRDLGLVPERKKLGALEHYCAENIDIFAGDIFDLNADGLGPVDAVYDRAALVALPAETRERYASHIAAITGQARQLLISFDYDQALMAGPPFSVTGPEITGLYAPLYQIEQIDAAEVPGGLKGVCPATETAWLLSPGANG